MTTQIDKQQQEEQQHIAMIADVLRTKHDTIPADTVNKAVDEAYRRFDGQPIRDFVPLLVERRAQELLGGTATAAPASLEES
ncbi:hypothetical protein DFR67_103186 [Williamsia limnetica]|uniref:Uncharacterized protein n=1 Tax=Williamsia limnetica TaxID=882452 RepID=A0A318RQT9_WILLI|nr:hypothetical protein [Williamsia limnetica]PYE19274.1 hypothetical protein DFR67_103186 [Williamsia limnetica]